MSDMWQFSTAWEKMVGLRKGQNEAMEEDSTVPSTSQSGRSTPGFWTVFQPQFQFAVSPNENNRTVASRPSNDQLSNFMTAQGSQMVETPAFRQQPFSQPNPFFRPVHTLQNEEMIFQVALRSTRPALPQTPGLPPYTCNICGAVMKHWIQDCPQRDPNPKTPYHGVRASEADFTCCNCRHKWHSSHIYADEQRQCHNCGYFSYPVKMWPKRHIN